MSPITIAIAGFTGRLARLTTQALLARYPDAEIRGIARSPEKVDPKISSAKNVKVFAAAADDMEGLRTALRGVDICVCCYLGDNSVMVDGQKLLIDACIAEQVPRYMASDYSLDYRPLALGDIPNKDAMKHVRAYLEEKEKESKIKGVYILNGGFTEAVVAPFCGWIDAKEAVFRYYGTGDEPIEMTTMPDVASYVAEVAANPALTGTFNVLGDSKSVKQMAQSYARVYGIEPQVVRMGSMDDLVAAKNKAFDAEPENPYAWMGLFFQYYMGNGSTNLGPLDNERFPSVKPKTTEEFLKGYTKDTVGNSMFI